MEKTLRILIVEDLESDAEILKRIMAREGIEFIDRIVETKEDFINALTEFSPDLILSDYSLPQFNGMNALLLRQKLAPDIPFVLVTGSINEEVAVECMKAGADDYIIKKNLIRLVPAIKAVLLKQETIRLRRKAEIALRESEEQLKFALSGTNDGIWDVKLETNAIYLSPRGCEILGYKPDEFQLIVDQWSKLVHPDDLPATNEAISAYLEDKTSIINGEHRLKTSTGDWKWILTRGKTVSYDQNGKALRIVGTLTDINERKQMEEALRESEELYRNLVLRMPDGVYKSTHEGKFVDVNPAMVKMLGYESKEELMAIDIKSQLYFEPADRESAVLQEKLVEMGIYRMKKKDGSEIWIEDHGWYNTDDKLNILFHEGIMRDITERKRTEDDILKERILLRTLIDNLPDSIFAKDKEGRKILANITDMEVIGCASEAEIIGKTDLELFPGNIGERGYADDIHVLQTGEPVINREEEFIDVEGKHRWLHTSKIPLFDELGMVTGLVGIGHDITIRKSAEEELRKLSRAVEQNPVAIIITDSDGTMEYVNPKFTELTGYTREEAIGKNPSILKSDTTTKEQYKQLWDTINSGGEWHGELRNKNKNGEIYFESAIISPISDESGRITHFLASMEDISRRKQAEEDIRQKAEELAISNEHLIRFNRLAIGREMRLIEIKKYCNQLADQLGIELPYPLAFLNENKNIIDGKDIAPANDDVEMKAQ